ncbi:MAG: shikimate kinase / 3-dehydroquinate synthase [Blastocatellia bacterium]|jgi:shikimate kinase|nr:shikimate kinase / 3-dehydroquinate synthase [Blastocatellia bacterium]
MDRRIVIVGFMGCGKTTVARALAARLDCGLVDLDAVVAAQERLSVPDLISERGEQGFRDAESSALQLVLDRHTPRIIALGGGAWTVERNRDLISKHNCLSVWLDAPFDLCWQRISEHSEPRPLAPEEPTARSLYRERHPLYALANLRVAVTHQASADDLAAEIGNAIEAGATPQK